MAVALLALAGVLVVSRRLRTPGGARPEEAEPPPSGPPISERRAQRARDVASGKSDVRGTLPAAVGDLEDDRSDAPKARGRHYAFAHGMLRQAQHDRDKWLRVAAASRASSIDVLVAALWNEIPEEEGDSYDAPPKARAIEGGALVRMPEVVAPGESKYVAIFEHEGTVRYFTLDWSVRGFALREWTLETHVEHGPCAGDEEAFLQEIARVLELEGP